MTRLLAAVTLVSVDGTDDSFVGEEDDGRVGHHSDEMSTHASIESCKAFL